MVVKQATYVYAVRVSGADRFDIRGECRAASRDEAEAVAHAHVAYAMKEVCARFRNAFAGELVVRRTLTE